MNGQSTQGGTAARWNWAEKRDPKAFLALEDGTILRGTSVGAPRDNVGEVVFNTGMSGYQEILSDPSYSGQFVTMTYPEIGNTGINPEDMESRRFFANGFIVHEMNEPSNWRSTMTLREALRQQDVPALAGVDTRTLTRLLRDKGTQKGFLSVRGEVGESEAIEQARRWEGLENQDYAARVSCAEPYGWDPDGRLTSSWGMGDGELPHDSLRIVALDYGIKWNILRSLRRHGMRVTVAPARSTAADILAMKPDGVFLSNGPADPEAVTYAVETARALIGKTPIMGICLGHQILGLAAGGRKMRLKFGHHGCNHPVKNLLTGKVEITSQNHNYAMEADSLEKAGVEVTHINLNDNTVEGLQHRGAPMFAIQYHPEAAPGPHDPYYLFERFRAMMRA